MPTKKPNKSIVAKKSTKKVAKKATKKRVTTSYIMKTATEIEKILNTKYGAEQVHGIYAKTLLVEDKLPYAIQLALQKINAIRNQAAHEADFSPAKAKLNFSLNRHNPQNNPLDIHKLFEETKEFLLTNKLKNK